MFHLSKDKPRWQQTTGSRFDFKARQSIILDGSVWIDGKNKKNQPESSIEFGTFIGDRQITLILDLHTCSEAQTLLSSTRFYKNGKPKPEHWTERSDRHKLQKKKVFFALVNCKEIIKLPCIIKYTRYAPGFLDEHDNLRISGKYVIDQCCAEITGDHRPGRADSNKGFTFLYDQVKSKKYYVKIEISW